MRVLITGITGFIGSRLAGVLAGAGHEVYGLSRDPDRGRAKVPAARNLFAWDPLTEQPPAQALRNVDAIVHLAGENVAGRWTVKKMRGIEESRVLGTRNLVAGMRAAEGSAVLLSSSAIGYYGDRGDDLLGESDPPGDDFLAEVCQAWESEADRATEIGCRVVIVRTGIVLAPGGGALQAMLPPFKMGVGGPLGGGRQWWSWIDRDDLVSILCRALEDTTMSGPYNGTAPTPMRQRDFGKVLGKVLRRPALVPTPAFALKLMLGGFSTELLSSKRVISPRLRDVGFKFEHPQVETAFRQALGS